MKIDRLFYSLPQGLDEGLQLANCNHVFKLLNKMAIETFILFLILLQTLCCFSLVKILHESQSLTKIIYSTTQSYF